MNDSQPTIKNILQATVHLYIYVFVLGYLLLIIRLIIHVHSTNSSGTLHTQTFESRAYLWKKRRRSVCHRCELTLNNNHLWNMYKMEKKLQHSSKIQLKNRRKRQKSKITSLHIHVLGEQHVNGVIIVRFNAVVNLLKTSKNLPRKIKLRSNNKCRCWLILHKSN